jgi:hypothetical protein
MHPVILRQLAAVHMRELTAQAGPTAAQHPADHPVNDQGDVRGTNGPDPGPARRGSRLLGGYHIRP